MTVDLTEMGASGGCVTMTQPQKHTLMTEQNMLALACASGGTLAAFSIFSDVVQKLHHRGSSRRLTTMTLKYTLRGAETRP